MPLQALYSMTCFGDKNMREQTVHFREKAVDCDVDVAFLETRTMRNLRRFSFFWGAHLRHYYSFESLFCEGIVTAYSSYQHSLTS